MSIFDRFNLKRRKKGMYLYTEQELDEYEAYIEEKFGKCDKVLHEIVSPDIHLDILVISPTNESPFYKLITMGVGAYRMNVPKEISSYELEYAELILYLPKEWDLNSKDEQDYWPIRILKIIGRISINSNTWIGFGHTIHGNENMTAFAENTKQNTILLLAGCDLQYNRLDLRLKNGKKMNIYQLFPLYQEELEYKQANSVDALLELFTDEDILPVINTRRENYGMIALLPI